MLWFEEIDSQDVALVKGENASLGEMIRMLRDKDISEFEEIEVNLKEIPQTRTKIS